MPMRRPKLLSRLSELPKQLVLLVVAVSVLTPLYFMTVTAFKGPEEYLINKWGLPAFPMLTSFARIIEGERILRWFANSALLSITSVGFGTVVASLAAYGIAQFDMPGKGALFGVIVSLMVIPPVIMIIPLFQLMVRWGLVNTYFSAILIYVGVMMPFSVYLLTSFFRTIPLEIIDSARIDGCSSLGIYSRIVMPLSSPALITAMIINTLFVWNELLIALVFLQKDEMRTLMAGLALFKGKYTIDVPLTMAGVLIATVPTLVLYVLGQRYFIRGLTAGAFR